MRDRKKVDLDEMGDIQDRKEWGELESRYMRKKSVSIKENGKGNGLLVILEFNFLKPYSSELMIPTRI